MIQKFEEYIKSKNVIKESFQSGKLRNIIKQHGKPKRKQDYQMLYDLKDNEIIDIVPSPEDFYKLKDNGDEKMFYIELEDGYCVVISNLGILKKSFKSMYDIASERHKERHKGNLGKHDVGDLHKKFKERVSEFKHKKNVQRIQDMLTDEDRNKIIESINDFLSSEESYSGYEESQYDIDYTIDDFELFNEIAYLNINYDCYTSDIYNKFGCNYIDIETTINTFTLGIEDVEGIEEYDEFTPDELQIDLNNFKPYEEKEVELSITDPYSYYGVSPSDFF